MLQPVEEDVLSAARRLRRTRNGGGRSLSSPDSEGKRSCLVVSSANCWTVNTYRLTGGASSTQSELTHGVPGVSSYRIGRWLPYLIAIPFAILYAAYSLSRHWRMQTAGYDARRPRNKSLE